MKVVFVGGPISGEKRIVPDAGTSFVCTTSPRPGVFINHHYAYHPILVGEERFMIGVYEKLTLAQVVDRLFGQAVRQNFA